LALKVRIFLSGSDSRTMWVSLEDVSLSNAAMGAASNVGKTGELTASLPLCRTLESLNQLAAAAMNHDVEQLRQLIDEGECIAKPPTPNTRVKILAYSAEADCYKVRMSLPEGDTQSMWASSASVVFPGSISKGAGN